MAEKGEATMVSDSTTTKRQRRPSTARAKSATKTKKQELTNSNEVGLGLGLDDRDLIPQEISSPEPVAQLKSQQQPQRSQPQPKQPQAALDKDDIDQLFKQRLNQEGFMSDSPRGVLDRVRSDDFVQDDTVPESFIPDYPDDFALDYPDYPDRADGADSSEAQGHDLEAVAEAIASYKQHMQLMQEDAERKVQAGLGADSDADAGAGGNTVVTSVAVVGTESVGRNLGIKRDSSLEMRDLIRIALVKRPYKSEEIYADPYYFASVCDWQQQASPTAQYQFEQASQRWNVLSVLDSADACSALASRINVAYIKYLQQYFPLGNLEDQEQFNVLLLVLFEKMGKGDVCINLSTLDSVYGVIAQWESAKDAHYEHRDDGFSSSTIEDAERFVMMVKRYAPQSVQQMHELVQKSLAVGSADEVNAPLVWSLQRLYVRRYFTYETRIADYIKQVATTLPNQEQESFLQQAVPLLFPEQNVLKDAFAESGSKDESLLVDWQKIAALMAITSNFTVISGGPGTGKTTTVLRMLLLLLCMAEQSPQIALCAPTGKAAARMGESILKQLRDARTLANVEYLAQLIGRNKEDIYAAIPHTAVTVQALLKTTPHHATPIFNAKRKLKYDILVVDEVSMLDLSLFYHLLEALEPQCKLILLGDKEQLSSVEAGSVLADLCTRLNSKQQERLQEQTLKFLCRVSGYSEKLLLSGKIADHVSLLQFSYRSREVKDIGRLATLVNEAFNTASDNFNPELSQDELKGDIYAYCEAVNKAPEQDSEHSPSPSPEAQAELDKIKQLFAEAKKSLSPATTTAIAAKDADTSAPAPAPKSKTKRAKSGKAEQVEVAPSGSKPQSEQAKFDAEVAAEIDKLWQPSKPAISYPLQNLALFKQRAAHDANVNVWERFKCKLAQDAVSRERQDNYAPFLQELEKHNFEVSSDLKEREILFRLMDKFRILCSNHLGTLGDRALNQQICKEVQRTYLKSFGYFGEKDFFPGQIIIVTKNDPVLGLVNGNVGFCAYEAQPDKGEEKNTQDTTSAAGGEKSRQDGERVLRVFIPVGIEEVDGKSVTKYNVISTLLLTNYENGFAMSIHKSQGSEYDKVSMVLVEKENRVLTKELVYTGITRAKKCVEVVSSDQVLRYALSHSVVRESGLSQRLLQAQAESFPQSSKATLDLASATPVITVVPEVAPEVAVAPVSDAVPAVESAPDSASASASAVVDTTITTTTTTKSKATKTVRKPRAKSTKPKTKTE